MKSFRYSLWEIESFVRDADYAIIGGGLVGINTAISLKENEPDAQVLVIERGGIPIGASTRNAGFACFGSITELLDDQGTTSQQDVLDLLAQRLKGLRFLRGRVGDPDMEYSQVGGYEVFEGTDDEVFKYDKDIHVFNQAIAERTGLAETFRIVESKLKFQGFNKFSIFNQYEGCLHPGKMMESLYRKAQGLGVRFLMGTSVKHVSNEEGKVKISLEGNSIEAKKVAICTNGFSHLIFPELDVHPARNQVLVTENISGNRLNSCFHFDKGYVYFRNIGDRILLGGGRNVARDIEETEEFGITDEVRNYLLDILYQKIGVSSQIRIEYEWSGILGIGDVKKPILKKQGDNIIFALRLGGMGVALGAKLGDSAAKLMLKDTTN